MPITDLPLELIDVISKIIDTDTFERIAINMRKKNPDRVILNSIYNLNFTRLKNYWKKMGLYRLINENDLEGKITVDLE